MPTLVSSTQGHDTCCLHSIDCKPNLRPPPTHTHLHPRSTFYAQYRGTFQCPEWLGPLLFPCRQYMSRALTASLPPGKVADLAEAAVARLFRKQGQKWEPQPAKPEGAGHVGEEPPAAVQAADGTVPAAALQISTGRAEDPQALGFAALMGTAATDRGPAAAQQPGAGSTALPGSARMAQGPLEVLRRPLLLPPGSVSWLLAAVGSALLVTWLLRREAEVRERGPLHHGSKPP